MEYHNNPDLFKNRSVDDRLVISNNLLLDFIDILKKPSNEIFSEELSNQLVDKLKRISNLLSNDESKKLFYDSIPSIHKVIIEFHKGDDAGKLEKYIIDILGDCIVESEQHP